MSFLGLKEKAETLSEDVAEITIPAGHFYYDQSSTQITEGPNFTLFITGDIVTDDEHYNDIESTLKRASGTFSYVLCYHDGRMVVGTDAMGFYPLYYHFSEERGFNFANTLPHLKHRLKGLTPNYDAWNELLNQFDVLGSKTTIKEISRLREGQRALFANGKFSIEDFEFYELPCFQGPDEFVAQNNSLLKTWVNKLGSRHDNIVIPLTGGEDSRRIAIAAKDANLEYSCITQSTRHKTGVDMDTFIAGKIAPLLNVSEHIKLPMPTAEKMQEHMALKDYWCGYESHQHEWAVNMVPTLSRPSLIFDGIGGDVVINQTFNRQFPNFKDGDSFYEHLIKRERNFTLSKSVLNSSLNDEIKKELDRYPVGYNQYTLYGMFNHTRRSISCWFNLFLLAGHKMALPYANVEMFMQSVSNAPETRLSKRFQRECLLRQNTEIGSYYSSRFEFTPQHWLELGAQPTRRFYEFKKEQPPIRKDVLALLDGSFKTQVLNKIFYPLFPNKLVEQWDWYYRPLIRFSQFLDWLETDESHLPALMKPDFKSIHAK